MSNAEILKYIGEMFPDETVQVGQRLKKHQVEIINMIALELKQRRIGLEQMRNSNSYR